MRAGSTAPHQAALSRAELHAAWTRRLVGWWDYYNRVYTGERMRAPRIELGGAGLERGRWDGRTRRMVVSARHIETDPWVEVLATLRHEMAHQYAQEVLRARDESPHGPAFRRACEVLRCLHGSRNEEVAAQDPEADRLLARVHKVLSLAASPNRHEAAAAVKHARRLLLAHNLEEMQLQQRRDFVVRHLGPVKGRHAAWEHWMAQILHEFFFTEVIWVESYRPLDDRQGTVLEICGSAANVEMAAYVYGYLTDLLDRLWEEYRGTRGLHGHRHRQRFWAGPLEGFCSRLREQERRLQREEGLVYQGDAGLKEFHSYLHPRTRVRRGGGVTVNTVYQDGLAEGRKIVVHRPVSGGTAGFGGFLTGAQL